MFVLSTIATRKQSIHSDGTGSLMYRVCIAHSLAISALETVAPLAINIKSSITKTIIAKDGYSLGT